MTFYRNKKVLVAGGTGTIGIPLVRCLVGFGAVVTVASVDSPDRAGRVLPGGIRYLPYDLTQYENCLDATRGQDFVFNLVGIKGSTGIGETRVASYLVPMLLFQTNLMESAFRNGIQRYLFVSSICAYPESRAPKQEDTVWNGMPKQNDRIPGLAKRIGEVQGEAYLKEYGWDAVRVLRPSNVYGPHDDFDPRTAQVIPALISRILGGENPVKVWGDGSAVRDFIYSDDAAFWMLRAMEIAPPCVPINLGSGTGTTLRELVELIAANVPDRPAITWDPTKPTGDPVRVLSLQRARDMLGYEVRTGLAEGIRRTVQWYLENGHCLSKHREAVHGN
jgi:GDP-L-fucose synthase